MSEIGFGFEIKAIDEAGYIAGIAAGYGNVDFGGDVIMPGALTKAIAGRSSVPMRRGFDDLAAGLGTSKTREQAQQSIWSAGGRYSSDALQYGQRAST